MAYLFSGSTDRVHRASTPHGAWPLSIFGRIRLPSVDSLEHCIAGLFESGVNNGYRLQVEFTGGALKARCAARDGGGASSATSTTTITDTAWHTVFGYFTDGTNRGVYLDNGGLGTGATSKVPGTLTKAVVGAQDSGGTITANSGHELADVAMWHTATITADERAALHAGVSPLLIRPTDLFFYCPLIRPNNDILGEAMTTVGTSVVEHPRVLMHNASNIHRDARAGRPHVRQGSLWVPKPMKVYDGTKWVSRPVKQYNGSSWVYV
jgi:hypothetical protein